MKIREFIKKKGYILKDLINIGSGGAGFIKYNPNSDDIIVIEKDTEDENILEFQDIESFNEFLESLCEFRNFLEEEK